MEVVQKLRQWNRVGAPIRRTLGAGQMRLITDASEFGYGFRLDGAARQWELGNESTAAARDWSYEDQVQHQVWRELLALGKCIEECGATMLQGRTVLVCTDAKSTLKYINWGVGSSPMMSSMMRRIFDRCLELQISLMAEHVSGDDMKATAVDSLSRWGEFVVRKKVYDQFDRDVSWGGDEGYTCDLYASKKTARAKVYCAKSARSEVDGGDTGCRGDARVAAFAAHDSLWVCPPLQVIQQAIECALLKGVRCTVIVPDWNDQPWHVYLRQEAVKSVLLPRMGKYPTMCDAASTAGSAHFVDKWRFRAFLLDPRKRSAQETLTAPTGSKYWGGQLELRAEERQFAGVDMTTVWQHRQLKVLDLCSGMGTVPWLLDTLGVDALVWECETDPQARAVAEKQAPRSVQLQPHDVWYWASLPGTQRLLEMKPHLIVAGFPCQGLSCANTFGTGLRGKSQVFQAVQTVVNFLRMHNLECEFIVECVDFEQKYRAEFKYVSAVLKAQPVILRAEHVGACYRKRAFWASFEILPLTRKRVDPISVLDAGRRTTWKHLPTIVASGTNSWNCKDVVITEEGTTAPLRIWEMEKAMGFPEGYTAMQGLRVEDRHRLIGNAFHAEVMRQLLLMAVTVFVRKGEVFQLCARQKGVGDRNKVRTAPYITRNDVRNDAVNERARKNDHPQPPQEEDDVETKVGWIMFQVQPIERDDDILARYRHWHAILSTVGQDIRITNEVVVNSLDHLVQRFGPQVAKVKRHRNWTGSWRRFYVLMLREMEALVDIIRDATRRAFAKQRKRARKEARQAPRAPQMAFNSQLGFPGEGPGEHNPAGAGAGSSSGWGADNAGERGGSCRSQCVSFRLG